MEAILVKVFATALALSQVATRPDTIKTSFDPVQDRAEVVQLLTDGCAHMRKAFDVEQLDLDGLIETAMTDTRGGNEEIKAFRGLKFEDLFLAYRQFCKKEKIDREVVDIAQVIEFYNVAVAGLPDHNKLKALSMPGLTNVHDLKGAPYAELYEPNHRRLWVKLADVPEHVQQAFIAAEDKRFFKHTGIDERSVIRAFIGNVADPNSRQGGSTITQQVAKNLLVGNEVSYERKIREMIVAARVEKVLSKQEILEIYLNAIFLGRSSWGIELAARSLLRQERQGSDASRGRIPCRARQGPELLQPRPPAHPRPGAHGLRPRPHAGRRHHHRRAAQGRDGAAAPHRHAVAAAARQRLLHRRPARPRGEAGRRDGAADRQILCGALDHPSAIAAGHGKGVAGRPRQVRAERRPHHVPRRRGEPRRSDQEAAGQ